MAKQKRCRTCKKLKPVSHYSPSPFGKYRRKPHCKICRNKKLREERKKRVRQYWEKGVDLAGTKKCSRCKQTKPKVEFNLNMDKKDRLDYHCRECTNQRAREYFYKKFPFYEELYKSQDGKCAICGTEKPSKSGRTKRLSIDHCHETNIVRGLLCERCNRALGLFGDDTKILIKAISYLLSSRTPYKIKKSKSGVLKRIA